jgi:hypothetical protein
MRYVTLALLAAACGSSVPNVLNNNSCSASVTGAVSISSLSCLATAGFDANNDNLGAVAFSFTNATGGAYQVVAGVGFTGAPATKTYANTDSGAKGAVEVLQTSGGMTWAAIAGASPSSEDQGSYSLSLTSLGTQINNPDGGPGEAFLSVHGTLTATMPAVPGTPAAGTTTLSATF